MSDYVQCVTCHRWVEMDDARFVQVLGAGGFAGYACPSCVPKPKAVPT